MNAQQEEELRQQRVRQAEIIKAEVDQYKVCLICSSVSGRGMALCPVCHAYQWDESPAEVIAAVDTAALSAFPVSLGFAPSETRQRVWPPPPVYFLPFRSETPNQTIFPYEN